MTFGEIIWIIIGSILGTILSLIIIYFIIKFMTYKIATWVKIVNQETLKYEEQETYVRKVKYGTREQKDIRGSK